MAKHATFRVGLTAALMALLLVLTALPGHAAAGFGETTKFDGLNGIQGTGAFVIEPSTSNNIVVDFECTVVGLPATATRIVSIDGCVLFQGNTPVGSAPGAALGSPATVTADRAVVDISVGGALKVCYDVEAWFVDGSEMTASGCTNSLLP